MFAIAENLQACRNKIEQACASHGRSADSVQLLAVSKTFGADAVVQAVAAGQQAFGENYVQEAVQKINTLRPLHPGLEWHFIGPIQSNKTRQIAEHFDWVHTIERAGIAERLSRQRPAAMPALNCLIQVNISRQASKSGIDPADCLALAQQIQGLPHLRLRGLMAIPAPEEEVGAQALLEQLLAMRQLFEQLQAALELSQFDTLSMGMSADLEAAIGAGSTLVRVGSAIFGARHYMPHNPAHATTGETN